MSPRRARALILALLCALAPALAAADAKAEKKKSKIDTMAAHTLKRLYREQPQAKALLERSYGYAVFDARQTKLMVSGGGGQGVAIERASKKRTYMKQASLGVGIGLGIQVYQVVFMFETQKHFDDFVEKGWEASAGANAAAGDKGENAGVSATDTDSVATGANTALGWSNGMAVFQMTEKGLMLQADISGTKYWKPDDWN